MSEEARPFVEFHDASEEHTLARVEGEDLAELVRNLVDLIDSDVQIQFDHHTTNVRLWNFNE